MYIHETPKDYDSDDVTWEGGGSGYRSKKDGKICILKCPACKKENYAMAVSSGQCCWCGFTADREVNKMKELQRMIRVAIFERHHTLEEALAAHNAVVEKLTDYITRLEVQIECAEGLAKLTQGIKDGAVANVNEIRALKRKIEKLEAEVKEQKKHNLYQANLAMPANCKGW